MKREILCKACAKSLRKLFSTESTYPGEHVKFVSGLCKFNYICDGCATPIGALEPATAYSSWADYGGIPYFEWESESLLIKSGEK